MFTKDIGIDLGTANTLVYMKGRGIIMREPSVVAVDPRSDELRVRSVGHEAKAVIGRAPGSIVAVRPLKDGVIADFDITAAMLQSFIRQACGSTLLARPRVVICVPSGVTEVERRAVRQAAAKAGARQVTVIEEPMAAAMGAGGLLAVDVNGVGITRPNRTGLPTTLIRSYWELGDILHFEPATARRNIELGYHDTLRAFGRLRGCAYAVAKNEQTAQDAAAFRQRFDAVQKAVKAKYPVTLTADLALKLANMQDAELAPLEAAGSMMPMLVTLVIRPALATAVGFMPAIAKAKANSSTMAAP